MPVAEKFVVTSPWSVERRVMKHPVLEDEQLIPTVAQEKDIKKFLLYNGLWLVLTYGADLLSLVTPWLGKGFRYLVKFKFRGKWEQKQIGI